MREMKKEIKLLSHDFFCIQSFSVTDLLIKILNLEAKSSNCCELLKVNG